MIALYALSDKDFSIFTTVTTATTVLFPVCVRVRTRVALSVPTFIDFYA